MNDEPVEEELDMVARGLQLTASADTLVEILGFMVARQPHRVSEVVNALELADARHLINTMAGCIVDAIAHGYDVDDFVSGLREYVDHVTGRPTLYGPDGRPL